MPSSELIAFFDTLDKSASSNLELIRLMGQLPKYIQIVRSLSEEEYLELLEYAKAQVQHEELLSIVIEIFSRMR
jgi:uncharacterized protein YktA (UPF0223 family)